MPLSLSANELWHSTRDSVIRYNLIVQRTAPTRANGVIRRGRYYQIYYISGYRYYIRECIPSSIGWVYANSAAIDDTWFTNIGLFHVPTAAYLRGMCGRDYGRRHPERTWPPITPRAPKYRGITNEIIS